MDDKKTYYDILEVQSAASFHEIQQGYIRAKNAYSGDSIALYSIMTKDECDEILKDIEGAYIILSDPMKRREYDKAHGIQVQDDYRTTGPSLTMASLAEKIKMVTTEEKIRESSSNIGKIISIKKYNLEYDRNDALEDEIEKTTEFTGELLKRIRENRKVDLERLTEMTKVSRTYLQNIEAEDVTNLPSMVYIRGFVYQYAKCLKLTPDLVATSYMQRLRRLYPKKE